jgi:ankyrin repeat protein
MTTTIRLLILVAACLSVSCKPQAPAKASSIDELIERVKAGDLESVRLTVDANKTLANAKRSDGVPLLYFAAASGHKDIVAYILDMGAAVDASTDYGSALHVAADNEYEEVVRLLLNRGADPNLKDDWQQVPLHNTTQNKNQTIAELLIDSGADINAQDHKGRTPLHRCKSLAVAKLLISKGADVNAVDSSGYTALHWAGTPREIVDRPTIEYLLANGADTARVDNSGLTPRQLAVKNSQHDLVAILDAHKP